MVDVLSDREESVAMLDTKKGLQFSCVIFIRQLSLFGLFIHVYV